MRFIKFCGLTRESDVLTACELGVQALGFVMWPRSPRYVSPDQVAALVKLVPSTVTTVAVLVEPSAEDIQAAVRIGVSAVQVHGRHVPPRSAGLRVWRASTVDVGEAMDHDDLVVLDSGDPHRYGGTGQVIDWTRAAGIAAGRRVLLAGGLTEHNVGEAIRRVRPFGVDVASGIERAPGVKNVNRMRAFVAAVARADEEATT